MREGRWPGDAIKHLLNDSQTTEVRQWLTRAAADADASWNQLFTHLHAETGTPQSVWHKVIRDKGELTPTTIVGLIAAKAIKSVRIDAQGTHVEMASPRPFVRALKDHIATQHEAALARAKAKRSNPSC